MTTKEEVQKLYEGKYFYQIVRKSEIDGESWIQLLGPFDNIYYAVVDEKTQKQICDMFNVEAPTPSKYKFVQVINGMPTQAFTEEEILVTDRLL